LYGIKYNIFASFFNNIRPSEIGFSDGLS
jgi:hypothetical protein